MRSCLAALLASALFSVPALADNWIIETVRCASCGDKPVTLSKSDGAPYYYASREACLLILTRTITRVVNNRLQYEMAACVDLTTGERITLGAELEKR